MKRTNIVLLLVATVVFVLLAIFMPNDILHEPLLAPNEYLRLKPHITFGDSFVWIVPSSTIIVYLLGIQIMYIGYTFIKDDVPLWGVSLLLWGIGTILAGTSYQGLGYMLKCYGQEYCLFTSWFELAYLFVTACSIAVMGLAFSKMFITSSKRKYLEGYSKIALIVYTSILVIGSIIQNRVMISYEIFTVFFMPLFLVFFIINVVNYRRDKKSLDKAFIILWILFLLVNVAYYVDYLFGFTVSLYENTNIWFSSNDVLHVALIAWYGWLYYKVKPKMLEKRGNQNELV